MRFRSSLLINDDLLIDPGPDLVAAAVRHGLDLSPVQAVLVTHPHTDHLEPSALYWRRKGFVATPLPRLQVYASQRSFDRILRHEGREIDPAGIHIDARRIGAFQRFEIVTGGDVPPDERFDSGTPPQTPARRYSVWTFGASHAEPSVEPMFFAVQQTEGPEAPGRAPALLYATDTGPFSDETWAFLERARAEGIRFDVTAIDSTSGLGPDSRAHMNLRQSTWHQDELRRRGLLTERAQRFAQHFSHNGTPPHEELSENLAPLGVMPAYDGLVVNA